MQIEATSLPGVNVYIPTCHSDSRGHFFESFNQKHFDNVAFVQDNCSVSCKGVVRGLHYQLVKPQGKLIRVATGSIFDVAVDVRKSSPTFGCYTSVVLSASNRKQLYIPPGFAHGFQALQDDCTVLYKTTEYWYPCYDRCIMFNDCTLNIQWPLDNAIVSSKDANAFALLDAEVFE